MRVADLGSILDKYLEGYYPMTYGRKHRFFWAREAERAIIPLDNNTRARASRMIARIRPPFSIEHDCRLEQVLACLSDESIRPNTWVKGEVLDIYRTLHVHGYLQTIEALREGELAGGLVGVVLPGVYVAETMFTIETNASKACLCHAVERYQDLGFDFIDVQQPHDLDHPATRLGEQMISLKEYLKRLRSSLRRRGFERKHV